VGSYLILTIFGIYFYISQLLKNSYVKLVVVGVPAAVFVYVTHYRVFQNAEYPFGDFHPFLVLILFLVFIFDVLGGSRVNKTSYLLLPAMFLSSNTSYHAFVVATYILVFSSPTLVLKVLAQAMMFTSVASAITQLGYLSEVFALISLVIFAFYSFFTIKNKKTIGEELIVSLALLQIFSSFASTSLFDTRHILILAPYIFSFILALKYYNRPTVSYVMTLILFGIIFITNVPLGYYLPLLIVLLRFCFCNSEKMDDSFLKEKVSPSRLRSAVILLVMFSVYYFIFLSLGSSWQSVLFIFFNLVFLLNINKFFESIYLSDYIACGLLICVSVICLL
tara:strand:- start:5600 stop:6607 length:1008 start_codon:yes stop_codon:yes gene_type:complete